MLGNAKGWILVLLGCTMAATGAAAQNLIPDGDFDLNASGWTDPLGVLSYSTLDAADDPESGSARLRYEGVNAASGTGVGRCLPITAGRTYHLGGRVHIPAGQSRTGRGTLFFDFYSGASCTGTRTFGPSVNTSAAGSWVAVATTASATATAPAGSHSAYVVMNIMKNEAGGSLDVHIDDLAFGICIDSPTSLCLDGERFLLEATFRTSAGGTLGTAQSVPLRADSGLFWFFGPENLELLVKVLDGCVVNQRHWVYLAATTDVEYHLKITDTANGAEKTYSNTLGVLSPAQSDVNAFSGCE